jgi:chromosome segregation ATPase
VHPVDRHHSDNPPAHPELLDLLAEEIIRLEYDVPAFLRELALTDAYQRSYQLPEDLTPSIETAREEIARLEARAEKLEKQALSANARVFDETMELDEAVAEIKPLREAVKSADAALAEAKKKQTEADKKLAEANKAVEAKQAQVEVVQVAVASSKKAAVALEEDKELATAAETIQKKSNALAGELEKLQEQAKGDRQAAEEAKQGVAAATTAAQEAADRLAQAEQQVRGLRDKLLASRKEAESNRSLAVHARREVTALETLIAYGEQKTRIAQLRESIPETETQLAQAEKRMQEATQTLSAKKSTAEEADKQLAAAKQSLQQAEGKRAETGTTAGLLEESLAKATEAKSRLKESEELEQAVATLGQTVESVRSMIQEQEKQVGQRKQDLEKKTQSAESARAEVATAEQELKSHSEQVTERKQSLASAREELETVTQANRESWKQIVEQASNRFQVAAVVSLTPEQLGLSVLQATGQANRQRASEKAKLDKEKPLSEEDQEDAEKRAQREREIDEATYAALSKTVNGVFVKLFAAAQGQPQDEFFATAEQALFFANGNEVRSWLNPGGGNLTERLLKLEDSTEFAEELYLSILTRMPNEQEVQDVDEYLQSRPDEREQAVTELAWALLTSAEFRFQH